MREAHEAFAEAIRAMNRWFLPGSLQIMNERNDQLKRWPAEHDDIHTNGELLKAAKSYMDAAAYVQGNPPESLPGVISFSWPWEQFTFKPSPDPVHNLRKAGALIAAEIDRLERKKRDGEDPEDDEKAT